MLVSPQEYLGLTDQLQLLTTKVKALDDENKRLNDLVVQHEETINVLNQRLDQEINKNKHIDQNALNVEEAVAAATQEQMKFFEAELTKIKNDANVTKIRQLEKKMTENRFNNHEMVDFYQKIQSLYMVLNNTKVAPPMPDLYKWATLRKNQQLNTTVSNNLGVSQRNVMGGSKISITKNYQAPSMNTSKIKMNSSKIGGSKMNMSKIQGSQNGQQRRQSRGNNELAPSKFRANKENSPPMGPKKKKNQQNVQVLSTQSLTQAINVDNLSFENPTDKLISLANKQSTIHVDI